MKLNRRQIRDQLSAQGMVFSNLELVTEGPYSVEDAVWNYMDLPHMRYVHEDINAHLCYIGHDFTAYINLQKLPAFRLPFVFVNYRICLHEGASLDRQLCEREILRCPWHGRGNGPCAVLELNGDRHVSTEHHDLELKDGILTIRVK